MGRPMRINLRDCTMPMLTAEDVVTESAKIPLPVKARYIPVKPDWLASLWVKLAKVSELLGTIINIFYKQDAMKPDKQDMEKQKTSSSYGLPGDVNPVPLTPYSMAYGQDRPGDHQTGIDRYLDPETFMCDQTNRFAIVPEFDLGQNSTFMQGEGGPDWGHNSSSEAVNAEYDINSLFSLDQFSSQCLDMIPTTTSKENDI
jgi:hypothetical protein